MVQAHAHCDTTLHRLRLLVSMTTDLLWHDFVAADEILVTLHLFMCASAILCLTRYVLVPVSIGSQQFLDEVGPVFGEVPLFGNVVIQVE